VLQGWRRSELPASRVLYEGVTRDPVPTFDGSQLLRSSSYEGQMSDVYLKIAGSWVRIAVRRLGLTMAALLVTGSSGLAQENRGTDEQRVACTPDVLRLCSWEIPNVDRIVACLR